MGLIRIILALAVVVAHTQSPLFGLHFFGGGVMAVESFFILSGFYMALVLRTKYTKQLKEFYFNRFIRLFPIYWIFLIFVVLISCSYWFLIGKPVSALTSFAQIDIHPIYYVWSLFSNLGILGIDGSILWEDLTKISINKLIFLQGAWSLSVEIMFYLLAPWILRKKPWLQIILFFLFLSIRIFIFINAGYTWTKWNYYFMPSAMTFFMAGSITYLFYEYLHDNNFFARQNSKIGITVLTILVVIIIFYQNSNFLTIQDWRYYLIFTFSIPFIFEATKNNKMDRLIGEYFYPLYLCHGALLSIWSPLRHFIPEFLKIYILLILCLIICNVVLKIDKKIQNHFKHRVSNVKTTKLA